MVENWDEAQNGPDRQASKQVWRVYSTLSQSLMYVIVVSMLKIDSRNLYLYNHLIKWT